MSGHTVGVVIVESLFSYGLMAVIALATAGFISVFVTALGVLARRAAAPPPTAVAKPAPAAPPAAATSGIDPAVVAAIGAAIHSVVGAHRIVYIGEVPPMGGWTGEVRQRHHGSHHPHHDH